MKWAIGKAFKGEWRFVRSIESGAAIYTELTDILWFESREAAQVALSSSEQKVFSEAEVSRIREDQSWGCDDERSEDDGR